MMRLLGFVIKLFFLLCLLVPLLVITLVVFSLQDMPLISENNQLTGQEIQRVKTFIGRNNPSHFKDNETRTLAISEVEANLLTRYVLNKIDDRIQAKVMFSAFTADIVATVGLPHNPIGDFINVVAIVKQQDKEISIETLKIGSIAMPRIIANLLFMYAHSSLQQKFPEYDTALNSIESFQLSQQQASVRYGWRSEIKDQLKNRLVNTLVQQNLKQPVAIYTQELITISQSIRQSRPTLTTLLQPLFKLAVQRSQDNNPIDENRALFIVLGAYMLDSNITGLWDKQAHRKLSRKAFYLRNREDLTRHFLVSAAIVALSDSKLAQTIGLDKELNDADGGSGFSFADLAADRAGVILAKSAFYSKPQARLIQQRLATTQQDDDFMPPINNLPEGLQSVDFTALYTDTGSATYKQVVQVIDKRIAACRLYR